MCSYSQILTSFFLKNVIVIIFNFYFFILWLCREEGMGMANVEVRGHLQESVFSFHCVGSAAGTQIIGL